MSLSDGYVLVFDGFADWEPAHALPSCAARESAKSSPWALKHVLSRPWAGSASHPIER